MEGKTAFLGTRDDLDDIVETLVKVAERFYKLTRTEVLCKPRSPILD